MGLHAPIKAPDRENKMSTSEIKPGQVASRYFELCGVLNILKNDGYFTESHLSRVDLRLRAISHKCDSARSVRLCRAARRVAISRGLLGIGEMPTRGEVFNFTTKF
jgi:hypothetical protein